MHISIHTYIYIYTYIHTYGEQCLLKDSKAKVRVKGMSCVTIVYYSIVQYSTV